MSRVISIHAPRTGSDFIAFSQQRKVQISIHAPRTGSDKERREQARIEAISIHAPRTGSDVSGAMEDADGEISIHAPRTGSDPLESRNASKSKKFQSTLPARGATKKTKAEEIQQPISIHAPRTGSDAAGAIRRHDYEHFNPRSPHGERHNPCGIYGAVGCHFNPRSPHGERRVWLSQIAGFLQFQSTLPARGATLSMFPEDLKRLFQSTLPARGATPEGRANAQSRISIHAPRTGSDITFCRILLIYHRFQSTLPARGATSVYHCYFFTYSFQSTLPARGATRKHARKPVFRRISIHAPRTGSDVWVTAYARQELISIHAPRTGSDSAK